MQIILEPEKFFGLEKADFEDQLQEMLKISEDAERIRSNKELDLEDLAKIIAGGDARDSMLTASMSQTLAVLFSPELQVNAVNYLKPQSILAPILVRVCTIARTKLYKNIFMLTLLLYLISLVKLKQERAQFVSDEIMNTLEKRSRKFQELLQKYYYRLLARLHKPKGRILELLPLTLAKTVLLSMERYQMEQLDAIYGMFNSAAECQSFVYQFTINLLGAGKGMALALSSVDIVVE